VEYTYEEVFFERWIWNSNWEFFKGCVESIFFFEILKIGLLLNYSAKNKKTMLKNNSFFYISINVSKSMQ